jgi:hypothetical protein
MAQVVQGLLCKCKALSSNASPTPKKKSKTFMKCWLYSEGKTCYDKRNSHSVLDLSNYILGFLKLGIKDQVWFDMPII